MPPPVGFDFETAKEILRLVKKNKNGSLNRPIDSETPSLNNPQMVFIVAEYLNITEWNADYEAWELPEVIKYLPFNASSLESGSLKFGNTADSGEVDPAGITCMALVPGSIDEIPIRIYAGYHLGFIVGYDDNEDAIVLIARPQKISGDATIEVVTDVICTQNGLVLQTAEFYGADYDNAIQRQFLSLTDVTPVTFVANKGRAVIVNDAETALEFGAILDAEYTTFIALSDTPATYAGSKADAYKTCIVASDGVSIAFAAADVTTTHSIEGGGNPHHNFVEIKLVGDTASPATDTFYGVDGNGDRAFRTIEITSLSDLPATLVGSGEYFLKVNAGETAIEFVAVDIQQILDDVAALLADVATLQADYITLEARVTALES